MNIYTDNYSSATGMWSRSRRLGLETDPLRKVKVKVKVKVSGPSPAREFTLKTNEVAPLRQNQCKEFEIN
jgi:hypothetical protein